MSDFFKKAGKEVADIGSKAIKNAISGMLSEIASEILKETGAKDIAKEKIMETGVKVAKNMDVDIQNIQKNLLKEAIKKELGLK